MQKIRALEAILGDSESRSHLPVGVTIKAVNVRSLDGKEVRIDYAIPHVRPTLIYVLRPSCSVCRGNAANINELARQLKGTYDVNGLSLERNGLETVVEHDRLAFPVYTDVPADFVHSYGLGGTPETIVVSAKGEVVKSWLGGYGGPLQTAIEQFFSVNLPGFRKVVG
jgi:hypothetical protein